MGAIGDAIVAYARPLLDETDGSIEDVKKAMAVSQLCFNLALSPAQTREQTISELSTNLNMSAAEFDDFRRGIIDPMIQRHQLMFPQMHSRRSNGFTHSDESLYERQGTVTPTEKPSVPGRYEPCPCNSGRKYKFCCGKKSV